jgi:hypothetical protein
MMDGNAPSGPAALIAAMSVDELRAALACVAGRYAGGAPHIPGAVKPGE